MLELSAAARTSELAQGLDLVAHQRDERRHHDGHAGAAERRHLVAERLAAAGRHQHQRVAAGHDVIDDLGLVAAELVEAEDGAEDVERLAQHAACLI